LGGEIILIFVFSSIAPAATFTAPSSARKARVAVRRIEQFNNKKVRKTLLLV
jgi:hypothetical protein